jgi:hypothetical protein
MTDRLSGVRLKMGRARKHLEELHALIQEFMQGDPERTDSIGGADLHIDNIKGKLTCDARIPDAPPVHKWGLVVGDVLHNLRSALDHLAWQLVLANGKSPTSRTEFPIFKDDREFKDQARRKVGGMSKDARTAIESLQPYATRKDDPEGEPLWCVQELSIVDKHRLLHLSEIHLTRGRFTFRHPQKIQVSRDYFLESGPVQDGTPIARFSWDPAIYREVDVEVHLSFDVAFGKAPAEGPPISDYTGVPIRDLLITIWAELDEVVLPALAPHL